MLSHQVEECLETIGRLEERGEPVTTSVLARERQVSPPSITEMLRRLAEQGLITHESRGKIALTESGRTMARSVMRRHRLWERFLHDVLGMRWDRVHGEACKLEHATSPEVERELSKAVGEGQTCPHGHAIPGPDGHTAAEPTIPLPELAPGQPARVVSVREEDPALLRGLERIGLRPGVTVSRLDTGRNTEEMALQVGQMAGHSLPRAVAEGIMVAPLVGVRAGPVVPLAELEPDETGTVDRLVAGRGLLARCLALGFTPGTPITVIRNPRSGPLIVMLRDTRVALGRGEAQKIGVVRTRVPNGARDA